MSDYFGLRMRYWVMKAKESRQAQKRTFQDQENNAYGTFEESFVKLSTHISQKKTPKEKNAFHNCSGQCVE